MEYVDERSKLHVVLEAKKFAIPDDEWARMRSALSRLGEAAQGFPNPEARITCIHHPRSAAYHVEGKLKLPGRTLVVGEIAEHLDSGFHRCIDRLVEQTEAYAAQTEPAAQQRVAAKATLAAAEDPAAGAAGRAASTGNYRGFRTALSDYEDWLRKRIGRWIQRYPEAEVQLGNELALGDIVEEVYLNAFERYPQRPREVPLHRWLEDLIDASLKELLRRPEAEKANASFARTLRETGLR